MWSRAFVRWTICLPFITFDYGQNVSYKMLGSFKQATQQWDILSKEKQKSLTLTWSAICRTNVARFLSETTRGPRLVSVSMSFSSSFTLTVITLLSLSKGLMTISTKLNWPWNTRKIKIYIIENAHDPKYNFKELNISNFLKIVNSGNARVYIRTFKLCRVFASRRPFYISFIK